jgi:hypothetical protein
MRMRFGPIPFGKSRFDGCGPERSGPGVAGAILFINHIAVGVKSNCQVVSKPPLEPNLRVGEKRLILEIPDVCLRLNVFSPP